MVMQCAPIRVVAYHFCAPANDPFFKIIRGIFALTLVGGRRTRLRFHSGEPIELKYQIKSYGIPVDLLPMTSTGNVKTTYLKQWIRLRNIFEEPIYQYSIGRSVGLPVANTIGVASATPTALIECPGSKDVVFRPGKPVMNHPGNVYFRSLIESKSALHDMATQTGKASIAREVADEMIETQGGRFLVWIESSCCWKAITDPAQQRHKVAIAFRNFKSYRKAMVNRQTVTEQTGALTGALPADNDATAVSAIFEKLTHGITRSCESSSDEEGTQRKRIKSFL